MRNYRTENGPFPERPHYEPQEIDRICLDALRKTQLLPNAPQPTRIDRFVEKHFGVEVAYERLPDGILGYTEFGSDGVNSIIVTSALDDEGGDVAERRIRTTLAHEAGHGLLHMHLFGLNQHQIAMFDRDDQPPKVMCRDVQGATPGAAAYDGRWWEWQANQAIGALLLPKPLVRQAIEGCCVTTPGLALPTIPEGRRTEAEQAISDTFDVNRVVARLRLNQLFGRSDSPQAII